MWTVLESTAAQKALAKAPREIRAKYTVWQNIVMLSSPQGLRAVKGFHDEALGGDMKGYRSSRLNDAWRVIYTVHKDVVSVHVEDVTHHVYRK